MVPATFLALLLSGVACLIVLSISLAAGHFLLRRAGFLTDSDRSVSQSLFGLCLQYGMGYGTLGFILDYCYFLNVPRYISNIAIVALFVLCCADAVKEKFHLYLFERMRTIVARVYSGNKTRFIRFYYVAGILLVIIYLPKVLIPWYDHDEMAIYGYMAKLIGNGWSFQDFSPDTPADMPMMVQSLDGMILYLTHSTLAVRMIRLINLMGLGLALFTFLRSFGIAKPYCAAAFCGLFSIPELGFLATSLKVDSTVMFFEAFGILALTKSFLSDDDTGGLRWSALGVAFSSFAVASRMSSIYLLGLCLLRFLYTIYKTRHVDKLSNLRIVPLAFVCIGAISYVTNWLVYNNPLHPFSTPLFNSGIYAESLDVWRGRYNIDLPSPLLQLYLVPHLALGWEVHPIWLRLEKLLGFSFVRATDGVSMSWLSPAMLGIFLAPLYFSVKAIRVLALEFTFLLVVWSFGIHYSRVFLAASLIPILISIMIMAGVWPDSGVKTVMARGVGYAFVLMTVVLLSEHAKHLVALRQFMVLPEKQAIFAANKRLLDDYNRQGDSMDLTRRDRDSMDAILADSHKPVVLTATRIGPVLHILFSDGLFKDLSIANPEPSRIREYVTTFPASHALLKRDSKIFAFDPKLREVFASAFPVLLYASNGGIWELRGRKQ